MFSMRNVQIVFCRDSSVACTLRSHTLVLLLNADAQSRRQTISNCKLLVDWTRGKNLILCSAASSTTELRGPQDVANLFSLLGFSGERAKAAISKNCRSLLANALRKKHFYKEAVKVEEITSGGQVGPAQSAFDDWLKWDPISSGEGDLLLGDMEKSFATSKTVKENAKTINFISNMNGLPVHGLQIKDLICVSKPGMEPLDTDNLALAVMETESDAAVEKPEEQGSLKPLHQEPSSLTINQCDFSSLSKDQVEVILLPEGRTSSSGATNMDLTSGYQDPEVPLNYAPKAQHALLPLPGHCQAFVDDAKIGCQISDFEDPALSSLPADNSKSANSAEILSISNEKLESSNGNGIVANHPDDMETNHVTYATQLQDTPSPVGRGTNLHDGEQVHITKIDNHVSLELADPLSKSSSYVFPLESTVENQLDMDVCAREDAAVDKLPDKIDIKNIERKPLASSDAASQDDYVEGGQYSKMTNSSVKSSDHLPIERFLNLTTDLNEPINDDVMGEQKQIDSLTNYQGLCKSQAGRHRRKQNLLRQHFLSPFKRFLKPRPLKRKARSQK